MTFVSLIILLSNSVTAITKSFYLQTIHTKTKLSVQLRSNVVNYC